MVRSSRLAHDGSTLLSSSTGPGASRAPLAAIRCCRTAPVSSGPGTRNARGNAERRSARSKAIQDGVQPRTTSGKPPPWIRDQSPVHRDDPQQIVGRRPRAASHTGPDRCRTSGSCAQVDGPGPSVAQRPPRSLPAPGARRSTGQPTDSDSGAPDVERGSASLRMSIRQPVRRAASRAFWPSLPMASDSWKSGTTTRAVRLLRVEHRDRDHLRRRERVADERRPDPPTSR